MPFGEDMGADSAGAAERTKELMAEIEMQKARADAAEINAEQRCALLEQKFVALMERVAVLENEKSELRVSLDNRSAESTKLEEQIQQLELQLIKRDANLQRQATELNEMQNAKKELLELISNKDAEMDEKNQTMKTYLDKVLALTEERSSLESRLHEMTAELARLKARASRFEQEKDIALQHNASINEELLVKVSLLLQERQKTADLEFSLQLKTSETEKVVKEKEEALARSQESVKELEAELQKHIAELKFVKEDAAVKEEHLSTEAATASKLARLYKQSSEEWSQKSNELEGVVKALKVHLEEIKRDYEHKVQREIEAREASEQEALREKEALEKRLADVQTAMSSEVQGDSWIALAHGSSFPSLEHESELPDLPRLPELPRLPAEISGTALASSLLRDGWTICRIYAKYNEADDALRHERQERIHCQKLLDRVLREIENKAEIVLEERAEYKRMIEAYRTMEESLRVSISERTDLERAICDLRATVKLKERELKNYEKDVSDLQLQVAILLKECADIQKRYGIETQHEGDELAMVCVSDTTASNLCRSQELATFKGVHELVQQNTNLVHALRTVSQENEQKEHEMKELFDRELKKRIDEATRKVSDVLRKSQEQSQMIESLRGTIAVYKGLYDDERSFRSSHPLNGGTAAAGADQQDMRRLITAAQEEARKELKKAMDQLEVLEKELAATRHDLSVSRAECARWQGEASFAKEKVSSMSRELDKQRKQMESVVLRNMELSQNLHDYERKLKESSLNVRAAEEERRKCTREMAVLEREKELLAMAESRASQEIVQLTERLHTLQTKLATIESAEEVREVARAAERKKLSDELTRLQKEWVDAKHQLDLERSHARNLTSERDKTMDQARERVEALTLELKAATAGLASSDTRAKVAEARCAELESNLKKADEKLMALLSGSKKTTASDASATESSLQQYEEDIQNLKDELATAKKYAEEYKRMALDNEAAMKQLDEAYRRLISEAASTKSAMDSELRTLQKQLCDVETMSHEKDKEAGALQANRETMLRDTLKELEVLKGAEVANQSALKQYETRIKDLQEELENVRQQLDVAQTNYQRQILLEAESVRELLSTKDRLQKLEGNEKTLLESAEKAEAELESFKVNFYVQKELWDGKEASLQAHCKELESQNSLLLNRLEARHVTLSQQDRRASDDASSEEADLQSVIQYLHRAKEAADTEVSLLKQENLRLSKQFEASSQAAEEAQAKLRQRHEKLRATMFTEEEFLALQSQIVELNTLRESSFQLREENKTLLETSEDMKGKVRESEKQQEFWNRSLKEKDLQLESNKSEIEFLKSDVVVWQQRVAKIIEKYKSLDVDDYEKVKLQLTTVEERAKKYENELETTRKQLQELQERESSLKTEYERKGRVYKQMINKRVEAEVTKRVDDFKEKHNSSEHEALEAAQKEIARSEQAQKEAVARFEQVQKDSKEKESRIQILEKTLEKEREELKKERQQRRNDRKMYMDLAGRQPRQQFQVPGTFPDSQQTANEVSVSEVTDVLPQAVVASEAPEPATSMQPVSTSMPSTNIKTAPRLRVAAADEREVAATEKEKARKTVRPRIVRPRLNEGQETPAEVEAEGEVAAIPPGPSSMDISAVPASHKRPASDAEQVLPEGKEDTSVPALKKAKASETDTTPTLTTEEQPDTGMVDVDNMESEEPAETAMESQADEETAVPSEEMRDPSAHMDAPSDEEDGEIAEGDVAEEENNEDEEDTEQQLQQDEQQQDQQQQEAMEQQEQQQQGDLQQGDQQQQPEVQQDQQPPQQEQQQQVHATEQEQEQAQQEHQLETQALQEQPQTHETQDQQPPPQQQQQKVEQPQDQRSEQQQQQQQSKVEQQQQQSKVEQQQQQSKVEQQQQQQRQPSQEQAQQQVKQQQAEGEDAKPASGTTISIQERARQNRLLRVATASPPSPANARAAAAAASTAGAAATGGRGNRGSAAMRGKTRRVGRNSNSNNSNNNNNGNNNNANKGGGGAAGAAGGSAS